jgi:hypothetical protein
VDKKLRSRSEVLRDFHMDYEHDPRWEGFIQQHDLGIPLAVLMVHGMAEPTESGKRQLLDTWYALCGELGADPEGDYNTIDDLIPNGPID